MFVTRLPKTLARIISEFLSWSGTRRWWAYTAKALVGLVVGFHTSLTYDPQNFLLCLAWGGMGLVLARSRMVRGCVLVGLLLTVIGRWGEYNNDYLCEREPCGYDGHNWPPPLWWDPRLINLVGSGLGGALVAVAGPPRVPLKPPPMVPARGQDSSPYVWPPAPKKPQ